MERLSLGEAGPSVILIVKVLRSQLLLFVILRGIDRMVSRLKTTQLSIPMVTLGLALLLGWLGCGKSEYDSRMQTRIQQLRTTATSPAEGEDTPDRPAPSSDATDDESPESDGTDDEETDEEASAEDQETDEAVNENDGNVDPDAEDDVEADR